MAEKASREGNERDKHQKRVVRPEQGAVDKAQIVYEGPPVSVRCDAPLVGLWRGFAVRDGNLITGQQNFSGEETLILFSVPWAAVPEAMRAAWNPSGQDPVQLRQLPEAGLQWAGGRYHHVCRRGDWGIMSEWDVQSTRR